MFADRREAGRQLAAVLRHWRHRHPVVLGVPRGGVPVAFEVADELDTELDVIVAHKIGIPYQPEVAMGAVAEHGVVLLSDSVVKACDVSRQQVAAATEQAVRETARRIALYRDGRQRVPLTGRAAVIVDDGIATGATIRAAYQAARRDGAVRVVLATPVAAPATVRRLRPDVDDVVALSTPDRMVAVGAWYRDFRQVSDQEVSDLLAAAARRGETGRPVAEIPSPSDAGEQMLRLDDATVTARWSLPYGMCGLVVVPHSAANARYGARGRSTIDVLNRAGYGVVLVDLLAPDEERDRARVHDIDLLANRLREATELARTLMTDRAPWTGYLASGTAAATALRAASTDVAIAAVVAHNGRLDLIGPYLPTLTVPVLLLVGVGDRALLDINRRGQARLRCPNRLRVLPGMTDQPARPGAHATMLALARDWFDEWNPATGSPDRRRAGSPSSATPPSTALPSS